MFSIFNKIFKQTAEVPEPQIIMDDSEPVSKVDLEKLHVPTWRMSPLEYWRYKQFSDQHYKQHKAEGKTIAGGFLITFTSTGIGDTVIVKCPVCGVAHDITDVDNW